MYLLVQEFFFPCRHILVEVKNVLCDFFKKPFWSRCRSTYSHLVVSSEPLSLDFKNGLYLSFNGKPCQIVWFQHVKPGKGPAFVKSKLRNLENGRILENTFTAGAKIETINVERRPYQFLYKDEDGFNFMHEETYEQIHLDAALVDNADLMKEGQHVEMMFLADEERCLTCELPTYVELEVTYTEPAVKGDTASTNAQKEITLETGAIIMAPLFINIGERIRVNTTDRSYGERVK